MDIKMLLSGKNKFITGVMVLVIIGAVILVGTQEGKIASNVSAGDNASPGNSNNKKNDTEQNSTGTELQTDNGGKMTLSIPFVGVNFLETAVKDHYNMPAGMKRIVVNINWDKTGWNLEISIGSGECPDSGTELASKTATTSPITIEYTSEDGEPLPEGQWFIHAKANDASSHRGESVTISYTITVYQ